MTNDDVTKLKAGDLLRIVKSFPQGTSDVALGLIDHSGYSTKLHTDDVAMFVSASLIFAHCEITVLTDVLELGWLYASEAEPCSESHGMI